MGRKFTIGTTGQIDEITNADTDESLFSRDGRQASILVSGSRVTPQDASALRGTFFAATNGQTEVASERKLGVAPAAKFNTLNA